MKEGEGAGAFSGKRVTANDSSVVQTVKSRTMTLLRSVTEVLDVELVLRSAPVALLVLVILVLLPPFLVLVLLMRGGERPPVPPAPVP